MTRPQIHPQVALPDDPALDADVAGFVVISVVAFDETQELLARLEGGRGRWIDQASGRMVDVDNVVDVNVSARFVDMADHLWAGMVGQLQRWRDGRTPLRMCSAPGKATMLIADGDDYMFLPRRADPQGVQQ